jgi:hypothetical protein
MRVDGGPVTFVPSAVRNLLRLIDGWDLLTLVLCPVGVITVVASGQNQRLGDLAAGTVVARERFARQAWTNTAPTPSAPFGGPQPGPVWDVSAITPDEVVTVRRFLERRSTLSSNVRAHLAGEIAARLGPKIPGADASWPPEAFLEALAAAKTNRY